MASFSVYSTCSWDSLYAIPHTFCWSPLHSTLLESCLCWTPLFFLLSLAVWSSICSAAKNGKKLKNFRNCTLWQMCTRRSQNWFTQSICLQHHIICRQTVNANKWLGQLQILAKIVENENDWDNAVVVVNTNCITAFPFPSFCCF